MSAKSKNKEGIGSLLNTMLYVLKRVHKISKSYITLVIVKGFLKAILPFFSILIPKYIIDEFLGQQRVEYIGVMVIILISGNFLFNLLNNWLERILEIKKEHINIVFETQISERVATIDYQYLEDPDVLDLKERAFFAIYNYGAVGNIMKGFSDMTTYLLSILGILGLILFLDYYIIAVVIGIIILNGFVYNKVQRVNFELAQGNVPETRAYVYLSKCGQEFSMAKDIRLYNVMPIMLSKIDQFFDRSLKVNSKMFTTEGKYLGITGILFQLQIVCVYAYLAFKVLLGPMTIGNFTMYAGAFRHFSSCVTMIVSSYIEVSHSCHYISLYRDFENMVDFQEDGKGELTVNEGHIIEFKDVSFKYPRSETYVLDSINVKIQPGDTLSIVGLNGAGKTTFIKLLTRLYEPTKGKILLDGKDIKDYSFDEYAKLFSVVFQDFKLLACPLRENINISEEKGTDHEIKEILTTAGFEKDLDKLDKGLDTAVYKIFDEAGVEFSGGQQQKIAISRAIYKDGPIVILDEPTAALDPISEHEIYKKFHQLTLDKTAIYISHRLSSCRFSDKILVFNQGKVEQSGHHDHLVMQKGLYATMWQAQAKYYE